MCHEHAGTIVHAKVAGTDEIIDGSMLWLGMIKLNFFGPFFGCCEFMMVSGVSDFTKDKECWLLSSIPFPSFPVLFGVKQYSSIPVFQYFSFPVSQCSSVVQRSCVPVFQRYPVFMCCPVLRLPSVPVLSNIQVFQYLVFQCYPVF
ncbi:hypothetical protein Glove_19g325 [Diversispora epigaea]|uniref:Uncharacterized protein n=1 Tax=Diversispora epigaea TaxID=1348612 RepID=A0A397JL72_9GLOM|nr:hypothetical protein Glove_19g325 [Diversispora epigaea]